MIPFAQIVWPLTDWVKLPSIRQFRFILCWRCFNKLNLIPKTETDSDSEYKSETETKVKAQAGTKTESFLVAPFLADQASG